MLYFGYYAKYVILVLIVFAIFLVHRNFSCDKAITNQMSPIVEENKYFIYNPSKRSTDKIKRGDIIYYNGIRIRSATSSKEKYLGRVVALPGDSVEVSNGTIKVNGTPISKQISNREKQISDLPEILVPRGHFFVMSNEGTYYGWDSLMYGPIPANSVLGRLVKSDE
jgi:signal peptidase I